MLKLYYELIKNLNVGTHAARRGGRATCTHKDKLTHTHSYTQRLTLSHVFFVFFSALCSLINKKRNTLCTMLNVIKIHKKKSIYFYCTMQQHESIKYLTDTTRHTTVGIAACTVLSTLQFASSHRFSSHRLSLMPRCIAKAEGVKIYVIRYKCI